MSIKELDNKAGQIDDKLKTRDSMNLSSEENEIKYKKVY